MRPSDYFNELIAIGLQEFIGRISHDRADELRAKLESDLSAYHVAHWNDPPKPKQIVEPTKEEALAFDKALKAASRELKISTPSGIYFLPGHPLHWRAQKSQDSDAIQRSDTVEVEQDAEIAWLLYCKGNSRFAALREMVRRLETKHGMPAQSEEEWQAVTSARIKDVNASLPVPKLCAYDGCETAVVRSKTCRKHRGMVATRKAEQCLEGIKNNGSSCVQSAGPGGNAHVSHSARRGPKTGGKQQRRGGSSSSETQMTLYLGGK